MGVQGVRLLRKVGDNPLSNFLPALKGQGRFMVTTMRGFIPHLVDGQVGQRTLKGVHHSMSPDPVKVGRECWSPLPQSHFLNRAGEGRHCMIG